MKKLSRKQWVFIAIALLAFAATKVALISWYLKQQAQTPHVTSIRCDSPGQGCSLPDGSVLRFASPPRQSQPFDIHLSKNSAATPAAEFSMVDMDMGFNRYNFVDKGDKWHARVTLPVCVTGSHRWQLDLHQGEQVYRIAFNTI